MTQSSELSEYAQILQRLKDVQDSGEDLESTKDWLIPLRDKLYTMFCSPMKEDYMREAFRWASRICSVWGGLDWISPDDNWSTDEEVKMFLCIARSSLAEMHILIPLLERNITHGDEPEVEDGKIIEKSADSEDYEAFGDHLIIIENVVRSLVGTLDYEDDSTNNLIDSFNNNDLKNLLEHLKEAISLIVGYLEIAHKHWQDITHSLSDKRYSSIIGAIRIVCVWLSEDVGSFGAECELFLIDLFIKILLIDENDGKDGIVMVLHLICTDNEQMIETLLKSQRYKEALDKYLGYVANQQESNHTNERRKNKLYKLRCGMVKDLVIAAERKESKV